jgi:hypothetical protein
MLVLEDNHTLKVVPMVVAPGSTSPVHVVIDVVVIEPVPALFSDGEVDNGFDIFNELAEENRADIIPLALPSLGKGRGHFAGLFPSSFAG